MKLLSKETQYDKKKKKNTLKTLKIILNYMKPKPRCFETTIIVKLQF